MSAAEVEPINEVEKNALGIEYATAGVIGTRLKDARQERNVTKEYIALKAKIRERYIDAIELGDWDILPPGLNGRGLVRLYAKELSVPLPEFEGFGHLQTVQTEKQSENLSHGNFTKKSRYQPAAEESAEIIKIVSRSEYKNSVLENQFANYTPKETVTNKFYQTKTHHTAAIITPNISDIIGIPVNNTSDTESQNNMNEGSSQSMSDKSLLNVLPLAKPVYKTIQQPEKIEPRQIPAQIEKEHLIPKIQKLVETPKIQKAEPKNLAPKIFKKIKVDFKLKKLILFLSITIAVFLIVFTIYRLNIREIKLKSQPLLSSERKLNSSNAIMPLTQVDQSKILKSSSSQVVPLVASHAKVDILSRVKIQINADGKEVFSGYQQPGILDIEFKNKAEILVYDASKVKLTYASWEHGDLGWNERKRKIILNAKPYEDEPN